LRQVTQWSFHRRGYQTAWTRLGRIIWTQARK
jgi:hypothetical protein